MRVIYETEGLTVATHRQEDGAEVVMVVERNTDTYATIPREKADELIRATYAMYSLSLEAQQALTEPFENYAGLWAHKHRTV